MNCRCGWTGSKVRWKGKRLLVFSFILKSWLRPTVSSQSLHKLALTFHEYAGFTWNMRNRMSVDLVKKSLMSEKAFFGPQWNCQVQYLGKGSYSGRHWLNNQNIVDASVAHHQRFNIQLFAKCSLIELFWLILPVSAVRLVTRHPLQEQSDWTRKRIRG